MCRNSSDQNSATSINLVDATPAARQQLLAELGYEFSDYELWKGWLFLEESSAEELIREYFIPWFSPNLRGVLRTYSAQGVNNLQPRYDDFNRLMIFVHLTEFYRDKTWIIADGDSSGIEVINTFRKKYSYLDGEHCNNFAESEFESYYPENFSDDKAAIAKIIDKQRKREAKAALLSKVKAWIKEDVHAAHRF